MNDQLQTELTNIITNINSGSETAWGFINKQTPEIIQQLLMWHGLYSFILFCMGVILLCFIVYGNYRYFKWFIEYFKKNNMELFDAPYLMLHVLQLFWIAPLDLLFNIAWLKIWLAPKIWLLEYIADLVKPVIQ